MSDLYIPMYKKTCPDTFGHVFLGGGCVHMSRICPDYFWTHLTACMAMTYEIRVQNVSRAAENRKICPEITPPLKGVIWTYSFLTRKIQKCRKHPKRKRTMKTIRECAVRWES